MKIELTSEEKNILLLAIEQLDKYYDKKEETCREFKWICHAYLPQAGDGYTQNKNVFDIQDKTIEDIKRKKIEARTTIMKIVNSVLY
jgi:hypothetical protein